MPSRPETRWAMSPLGATGLAVSPITVGGAPLGSMPENFGYEVAEAAAIDLVQQILASPIRMLDTSNGYSGGESERRIGRGVALAGGLPDDFLVATKVDASGGDYSGERVRASVAESRERLGIDVLPLVYLHDPEFHDFDAMSGPGGAVEALVQLRDEGVIGHVGLAGGDVHEMARYLALREFEVVLVHNRWTLVDRSAEALVAQAQDVGAAIANAAIYGGGILAAPYAGHTRYGYREAPPTTLDAIRRMADACVRAGTDLQTAALLHSVRDPRVATTVVGFSKPERIGAIVGAIGTSLPDELWTELEELLPPREDWLDAR